MEESFNSKEYVRYVAEELISEFERAGKATTPVLVGSARETAIRAKLASLFPSYVGVGTGCVIDTFGKTSKQTDIILYEKDICPVYSINNTPETTYYPCEGVIGVGEVKSTLTKSELEKAFKNIASTKECQRYYPPSKEKTGYRISVLISQSWELKFLIKSIISSTRFMVLSYVRKLAQN